MTLVKLTFPVWKAPSSAAPPCILQLWSSLPGREDPSGSVPGPRPSWGVWGGSGRRATRLPSGHPSAHFPVERPLKGSEPPALAMYGVEARVH